MRQFMLLAFFVTSSAWAGPANQCPSTLTFRNARFINNQQFPTDDQIETNFKQTFRAPFEPSAGTWMPSELRAAQEVVNIIKENYVQGALVLHTNWSDRDHACVGALFGVPFTADNGSVRFDLNTMTSVTLAESVTVTLNLPGNCSNCVREAELFQFGKVEISK